MATSEKLTYLAETKSQLKNTINYSGASITDDTFRQYPRKLYTQYLDILKNPNTLFNGMPKVPEQTGTELSLNDTADTRMKLELNPSELTQETTTGKNKFNPNALINYRGDASETITTNKIKITDTASSAGSHYVNFQLLDMTGLEGKTVRLKAKWTTSGNNVGRITLRKGTTGTGGSTVGTAIGTLSTSENTISYTIPNDLGEEKMLGASLYSNYGISTWASNCYVNYENVIITIDNSDMTYEPYTGGTPQPNPDYPSEVQVIKGNNSIKIENKNLLNPSEFAQKVIDTPYSSTNISTYDSVTGELIIKMGNGGVVFDNFKENTQYTIILKYDFTNQGSNLRVDYTDGTTSNLLPTVGSGTFRYLTTNGKSVKQIIHNSYDSTGTRKLYLFESGIFEGDIAIEDYVAHQEQVLPLNLPVENLFDKANANILNAYPTATKISAAAATRSFYIPIIGGKTYTISKIQSARFAVATTAIIPAVDVSTIDYIEQNTATSITVQTSSTAKYLFVFYYNSSYDTLTMQEILDTIQIEEGTKANQYTPYGTTPIEYCKIGDYADEFEHDGDKWYLNKYTGKVVLDGSENWFYYLHYLQISISNAVNWSGSVASQGICNSYICRDRYFVINETYKRDKSISIGSGFIAIYDSNFIDATTFKTWLSTHNTTVYYALAIPTHTEITDSTLISQLNAIEKAVSYDEQTNISQTNTGLPFRIKASAIKNLESVFE